MYLRITRGRFDSARYDELVPLSREVNAAVQALPGCQSVHGHRGDLAAAGWPCCVGDPRARAVSVWHPS